MRGESVSLFNGMRETGKFMLSSLLAYLVSGASYNLLKAELYVTKKGGWNE